MHGNPQEKVKDGKVPRRHRPSYRVQAATYGALSDGGHFDHSRLPLAPLLLTMTAAHLAMSFHHFGALGLDRPSYIARSGQIMPMSEHQHC